MKETKPLISIIVPVYNVEKYLKKCLDSIIEQDYNDYELILINDGSTDSSLKIIKDYANKYDRIVAHDRENKGVLYTRVEGTKMARGKYIMFVDSDDWLEKDALKIFADEIAKGDYDIIKANYIKVDGNNAQKIEKFKKEEIIYKEEINNKIYENLMMSDIFNTVWGQVIKKDIIDLSGINTDISMGDDIIFNLVSFRNMNKMKILNNYVYNYWQNDTSITHDVSKEKLINNIKDLFGVYTILTQEMIKYGNPKNLKMSYIRYLKKANYALFRVIRKYEIDNIVLEKIDEVLYNDITKEAKKIIKISDIIFMKEFLFIWLILKEKKNAYIGLLKILTKIKK